MPISIKQQTSTGPERKSLIVIQKCSLRISEFSAISGVTDERHQVKGLIRYPGISPPFKTGTLLGGTT